MKFVFDETCLKEFKCLKEKLISSPIILSSDWALPFEVMCDTRSVELGAVLGQRGEKILHLIYYASNILNPTQKNDTRD